MVVTIECGRGQTVRTRIDRGRPEIVRRLPDGVAYPANYGFAAGTLADDGEAIDVFVLGGPRVPLDVVRARVVGAVEFWDARGADEKLVAVPCEPDGDASGDGGAGTATDTTEAAPTGVESEAPDPAWAADFAAITAFLMAYKPPEQPHRVGRVLGPDAARGLLARARRRALGSLGTGAATVRGVANGATSLPGGGTHGSMA